MESLKENVDREKTLVARKIGRDIKKKVKAKPRNKAKLETLSATEAPLLHVSHGMQEIIKEEFSENS